uniref:Uncharacterized protein n=1 Tax=Micrurus spixii TaxID=129469 RepID=A0A2D4MZK8_9SAUR
MLQGEKYIPLPIHRPNRGEYYSKKVPRSNMRHNAFIPLPIVLFKVTNSISQLDQNCDFLTIFSLGHSPLDKNIYKLKGPGSFLPSQGIKGHSPHMLVQSLLPELFWQLLLTSSNQTVR